MRQLLFTSGQQQQQQQQQQQAVIHGPKRLGSTPTRYRNGLVVPPKKRARFRRGRIFMTSLYALVFLLLLVLLLVPLTWYYYFISWNTVIHDDVGSSGTVEKRMESTTTLAGNKDNQSTSPKFRRGRNNYIHINHTTVLTERPPIPIVIAYAISLIKCGDMQSTATGLIDAAIVLRHSIHQTSSRVAKSHYDYRMYVIVETDAKACSGILEDIGFIVLHRDSPVSPRDIQDPFLRANIGREWCCGAKEFVKLYAYTLNEPVVVHVDIDFVLHRPMDNLFDVLLYDDNSVIGQTARSKLEVERRNAPHDEQQPMALPTRPQAAFTMDWGQVVPGYQPLFQAGFLVARTNPQVLQDITHIIKTETYVPQSPGVGFKHLGWGGTGIGTYVGAMAMQGIVAYYYQMKAPPGVWIELNQCRYNHMGMDTKMRGEPNFVRKYMGKCRNNSTYCEDCMVTPIDDIYNIHYTQCRKPWLCVGEGNEGIPRRVRDRTRRDKLLLPVKSVHVEHCLELAKVWHDHRTDLERRLEKLTGDESIASGQSGSYMEHVFGGHCTELGPGGYLKIGANTNILKRAQELYGEPTKKKKKV